LPLSLIEPLAFTIDDKTLKRAGLDYWPHVDLNTHQNFQAFEAALPKPYRLIGCSRHQGNTLSTFQFQQGDVLLFGREDTGLPAEIRERCDLICTIPMRGHERVRSLNLSVSCALVSFQAGLQLGLW
jgi:tRNA (cytidine/uridine-2'-O-)-methyltransferase